jgi:hypothetical protein
MANTITTQVLNDGSITTAVKVTILGDGSGDETNTVIFDASAYDPAVTSNKLRKIDYTTVGASAVLLWDATANVPLMGLPADYSDSKSFISEGGLINQGGAGVTGDILISTTGLGSGDLITLVLVVDKRDITIYS